MKGAQSANDPVRIVESAYKWQSSESAWLAEVLACSLPYAAGRGAIACTLRTADSVEIEQVVSGGGASDEDVDAIRTFCRSLAPSAGPELFAPTEIVGNATYRLERIARSRQTTPLALSGGVALPPMWALLGGQPRERAIMVAFLAPSKVEPEEPFPHDERRILGMVAAHLGAALRLRALAPSAREATLEAVLSPTGDVLHAEGAAKSKRSRESLSMAVLRSERARGKLRRVAPERATELWTALTEGRWSILEAIESDGKRYLLARKNQHASPDILELSTEESAVVWLAAEGHSHKYIGYELGISIHAVVRRLNAAMRKLRVGSRRELLSKLGVPA